jgi:hypothetical protein
MTLPEARAAYRTWPQALRDELNELAAADPLWTPENWCNLAEFVRVSGSPERALRLVREWRGHARAAAALRKDRATVAAGARASGRPG